MLEMLFHNNLFNKIFQKMRNNVYNLGLSANLTKLQLAKEIKKLLKT